MTPFKRNLSTPGDESATTQSRLADDLTRVYRAVPPPSRLDPAVLQAIRAATLDCGHALHKPARPRLLLPRRIAGVPRYAGLAALAAALLIGVSGLAGYPHLGGPTPVSAQTVLRHAAALALAPNQAAHLTDSVTMTFEGRSSTGTADIWLQTDANGSPALSVQTLDIGKPGTPNSDVPALHSRFVQVGQQVLAYNPELRGDNTILLGAQGQTRAFPSWVAPNDVFDGASAAQSLSALAKDSPQQVRLLPQQTLGGVTVDVIEVDGWAERPAQRTTLYFDAQSYVLRGFDTSSLDPSYPTPSWQARLNSYETMAASAVPPQTFALDAPATATIHPLDLGGPEFSTFAAAIATTCHSTVNPKELLRSGQSLLAGCQATAPAVTAPDLVAALAAPQKAALDAASSAGVLTSAQATDYLSGLEAQLTTWITSPTTAGPAANAGTQTK